jgi:hypothetical protein
MTKRPLSLTIIGWWLAISAVFGIYGLLTMQSNPTVMQMIEKAGSSLAMHQAFSAVGIVVAAICSYGIFKGLPWARVLYIVWTVVSLAVMAFVLPMVSVLVLSVVFFAVISFFLFRPAANEWFAARGFQLHRNAA